MPFSLADCFLNSSDPEKKRRPGHDAAKTAPAAPPVPSAAPAAPSSDSKPGVPAQPRGSAAPPGPGVSEATVNELKALLGELSTEWKGMVEAVQDFKKALDDEKGLHVEPPPAPRKNPPAISAPAPAPVGAPQATPAKTPVTISVPASNSGTGSGSGTSTGPAKTVAEAHPEIDAKLGELLRLLKDSVAAKSSGSAIQTMEIPKNLTLEIAREVAGRVKESVLATMRMASPPSGASGESAPREKEKPKDPPSQKRIPLDDVSALIDQIVGQG